MYEFRTLFFPNLPLLEKIDKHVAFYRNLEFYRKYVVIIRVRSFFNSNFLFLPYVV